MKVACLFDGAGLARLGLEQAGHDVTGFELDPVKHHLGKHVGSGNTVLADATTVNLSGFDAVWASPPCQVRSVARTQGAPVSAYAKDYLQWCLGIPCEVLWVENIMSQKPEENTWGIKWNAAQFTSLPLQNRNRVIGGRYRLPKTFRIWRRRFQDICMCITATEWKGCPTDRRRAARSYGRKLTVQECSYHQGFEIPGGWFKALDGYTEAAWRRQLYEAIGNGVPCYMSKAFGEAYKV